MEVVAGRGQAQRRDNPLHPHGVHTRDGGASMNSGSGLGLAAASRPGINAGGTGSSGVPRPSRLVPTTGTSLRSGLGPDHGQQTLPPLSPNSQSAGALRRSGSGGSSNRARGAGASGNEGASSPAGASATASGASLRSRPMTTPASGGSGPAAAALTDRLRAAPGPPPTAAPSTTGLRPRLGGSTGTGTGRTGAAAGSSRTAGRLARGSTTAGAAASAAASAGASGAVGGGRQARQQPRRSGPVAGPGSAAARAAEARAAAAAAAAAAAEAALGASDGTLAGPAVGGGGGGGDDDLARATSLAGADHHPAGSASGSASRATHAPLPSQPRPSHHTSLRSSQAKASASSSSSPPSAPTRAPQPTGAAASDRGFSSSSAAAASAAAAAGHPLFLPSAARPASPADSGAGAAGGLAPRPLSARSSNGLLNHWQPSAALHSQSPPQVQPDGAALGIGPLSMFGPLAALPPFSSAQGGAARGSVSAASAPAGATPAGATPAGASPAAPRLRPPSPSSSATPAAEADNGSPGPLRRALTPPTMPSYGSTTSAAAPAGSGSSGGAPRPGGSEPAGGLAALLPFPGASSAATARDAAGGVADAHASGGLLHARPSSSGAARDGGVALLAGQTSRRSQALLLGSGHPSQVTPVVPAAGSGRAAVSSLTRSTLADPPADATSASASASGSPGPALTERTRGSLYARTVGGGDADAAAPAASASGAAALTTSPSWYAASSQPHAIPEGAGGHRRAGEARASPAAASGAAAASSTSRAAGRAAAAAAAASGSGSPSSSINSSGSGSGSNGGGGGGGRSNSRMQRTAAAAAATAAATASGSSSSRTSSSLTPPARIDPETSARGGELRAAGAGGAAAAGPTAPGDGAGPGGREHYFGAIQPDLDGDDSVFIARGASRRGVGPGSAARGLPRGGSSSHGFGGASGAGASGAGASGAGASSSSASSAAGGTLRQGSGLRDPSPTSMRGVGDVAAGGAAGLQRRRPSQGPGGGEHGGTTGLSQAPSGNAAAGSAAGLGLRVFGRRRDSGSLYGDGGSDNPYGAGGTAAMSGTGLRIGGGGGGSGGRAGGAAVQTGAAGGASRAAAAATAVTRMMYDTHLYGSDSSVDGDDGEASGSGGGRHAVLRPPQRLFRVQLNQQAAEATTFGPTRPTGPTRQLPPPAQQLRNHRRRGTDDDGAVGGALNFGGNGGGGAGGGFQERFLADLRRRDTERAALMQLLIGGNEEELLRQAEEEQLALALMLSLQEARGAVDAAAGSSHAGLRLPSSASAGDAPAAARAGAGGLPALLGPRTLTLRVAEDGRVVGLDLGLGLGVGLGLNLGVGLMAAEPSFSYEDLLDLEDVKVTTPPEVLDALPYITYDGSSSTADGTCAICQCEYEQGDRLVRLPCSHVLHAGCARKWLGEYSKKCPVCKQAVC